MKDQRNHHDGRKDTNQEHRAVLSWWILVSSSNGGIAEREENKRRYHYVTVQLPHRSILSFLLNKVMQSPKWAIRAHYQTWILPTQIWATGDHTCVLRCEQTCSQSQVLGSLLIRHSCLVNEDFFWAKSWLYPRMTTWWKLLPMEPLSLLMNTWLMLFFWTVFEPLLRVNV